VPELPEVETARLRLQKILKGQKIVRVKVDRDDLICFDRQTPLEVARALRGATVTGTGRKGKYFWLELDRKPWLMLHLGMTGNVEIRRRLPGKNGHAQYGWGGLNLWQSRTKDLEQKVPRFCRLLLFLENGSEVAVTDPRRFGRIRLNDDPANSPSVAKLGFDPLQKFPPAKKLLTKLQTRRVAIKAVLLDQSIFAGVGNWIADEVLYQAGIDPHRSAAKLTIAEVIKLRRKLMAIVTFAVRVQADYDRYPKYWLFHYRWGKAKDAKDFKGRPILHETIGGRTTAWVPEVQYLG
jgi:formamidopyrimidine-DNA glycosylase